MVTEVRTEVGLDARHWTTVDGHMHVSVPTGVPEIWIQRRVGAGLSYFSQDEVYEIRRRAYGKTQWSYTLLRDGVELPLASIYSRLMDAKERAVKNARGQDRVGVA
jgi:hypothetical protein